MEVHSFSTTYAVITHLLFHIIVYGIFMNISEKNILGNVDPKEHRRDMQRERRARMSKEERDEINRKRREAGQKKKKERVQVNYIW